MGWTAGARRWTAGLAVLIATTGVAVGVTAPAAVAEQAPQVTVQDTSVDKPQTGDAVMPFLVRITAPAAAPVVISYATGDDNAIDGRDYTGASGSVTIFPGNLAVTVKVPVLANTLVTGNRDFRFSITAIRGGTGLRTTAYGYIIDTSAPAYVSAKDAGVVVHNGQTSNVVFPVVLDKASPNTVSVRYSTGNGGARAGLDYTATSGVLTFAPGVTSQNVTVPVIGRNPGGVRLGFVLNLGDAGNASIVNGQVSGFITVDDRRPYFSVDDNAVVRPATGGTNVPMTVRLLQPLPYASTVNYRTYDGSAIQGTDYNSTSGTLTFAAGATTQTVTVRVLAGGSGRKDLTVRLDTPSAGGSVQHNGTLWVQDAANRPQLTVNDTGVARPTSGSTTTTFTIAVNPAPTSTVTVNYTTADNTARAGTDYTATAGSVVFSAGQRTKTVTVPITGSTLPTGDLLVLLSVSSPDADVVRSGNGVIVTPVASQQTPLVSVLGTAATVPTTGSGSVDYQLTLTTASANTVTVDYATHDNSARAGVDYNTTNGTATFAPGQTSVTVAVPLIPIATPVGDRSLYLQIGNPTNAATSGSYYQYATLHHTPTQPVVSVGDATAFQNPAGPTKISFSIRISSPAANDVSVNFHTGDGSAHAGTDYVARTGTVVIPAGAVVRTVDITVTKNVAAGAARDLYLYIDTPVNAYITTNYGRGLLLNGLPQPYVSVVGTVVTTGAAATTATFGFTLSTPTTAPVTLNYTTQNDSAQAGLQYTATSGTVTIPAGATTATASVPVAADTSSVDPTRFYLQITGGVTNALTGNQYYAYAVLEHTAVRARINGGDVVVSRQTTGSKNAVVTLTMSPPSTAPVTVVYGTSDGSAVAGTDYTATTGTATFAAGATTATVNIPLIAGPATTPERTFYLYLSNVTGPAAINRNPSYIQIESPTTPTTYLTVDDTTGNAPSSGTGNATFTLRLSPAPTAPVNVVYNTRDNSAVAGADYTPVQGTVTFAAGQGTQTVAVPLLAHPQFVGDESFFLDTGIASGPAAVQRATGTAVVLTSALPAYLAAGPDLTVVRGASGSQQITLTASLAPAQTVPVTVQYQTVDQGAVAGRDYVAASGTLTFAPGQTSATYQVTVLGAPNILSNLGFYVQFSNPQNANLGSIEDQRTYVGLDAASTFSITGTVVDTSGAPLAGATITRTGGNQPSAVATSQADGSFAIPNSAIGTFTLTASLAGYGFQPPSTTVLVDGNNPATVAFIGFQGFGLLAQAVGGDGTPLSGVTITRTGGSQPTATATTNAGGYVAFGTNPNGTYTLTASAGGATAWIPATFSVVVNNATAPNHQFVQATGRYAAGRVVDVNGVGVSGVRVTRSPGGAQVSTSTDGYYVFNELAVGSYTITPSRAGRTFSPTTRTANVTNTVSPTGLDFTIS